MGSQVSVVSGTGKDGQPARLVLMKIKNEFHDEDQKLFDQQNDKTVASILGGFVGSEQDRAGDTQHRYLDKARTSIPDLFKRKRPKAA